MTTPTTAPALATAADLAAYLGGDPTNADQAAWMLDTASTVVRDYCGWTISRETGVTWTLDHPGGAVLLLPTLKLDTATVTVTDNTAPGGPAAVTDYTASELGILTRTAPAVWPAGDRTVTVTADHGYATVPRNVVAVVCAVASRLIATAGRGPVTTYRVGGISATYRGSEGDTISLPDLEAKILTPYRITGGPR